MDTINSRPQETLRHTLIINQETINEEPTKRIDLDAQTQNIKRRSDQSKERSIRESQLNEPPAAISRLLQINN